MTRASRLWALAALASLGLAGLPGCSETVQLPPAQIAVGAFPAAISTNSEALLTMSVGRDCSNVSGHVCTVCGSLFPAGGGAGADEGALYDPRDPVGGARTTVKLATTGGETDLVYRSPATPGGRVISFLLFDDAVACDGSAPPVAAASVRVDVSDSGQASPASTDAGAGDTGGGR